MNSVWIVCSDMHLLIGIASEVKPSSQSGSRVDRDRVRDGFCSFDPLLLGLSVQTFMCLSCSLGRFVDRDGFLFSRPSSPRPVCADIHVLAQVVQSAVSSRLFGYLRKQ